MNKIAKALALISKIANELDGSDQSEKADTLDEAAREIVESVNPEQNSEIDIVKILEEANQSGYLDQILKQRNPSSPEKAGSTFQTDLTSSDLVSANWIPYSHSAINPPAQGFSAPIPGTVGIVNLADLPEGTMVMLTDPKGTHGTEGGGFSAEVRMDDGNLPTSDSTTMLIGPGREGGLALWTIFPGDPTGASIVGEHEDSAAHPSSPESFRTWQEIPVSEAIMQGLSFGKVVESYSSPG